ncbi:MAG: FAD-binding oxidoreductase [Cytophagales bacterium]|nr:MAG: FAD-binding oxidoreductase [Cytophagales bacterium]
MNYTNTISGWGNFPRLNTEYRLASKASEFADYLHQRKTLIPRGLGRSYADQAINPDGITINCNYLNKYIDFDPIGGILDCEAGVSLDDIISTFAPLGWFPFICPGTKFVTIGGAIANDIHGKAHHVDGSFVNCVLSFDCLLADGSVKTCSRTQHSDLFWASFGGLGLLGIILKATIQLRKIDTTFFKQKSIVAKNLDALLDAIDEADQNYNYSVAWIDSMAKGKHLGTGVLTIGNSAELTDLPQQLSSNPLIIGKKSKLSLPFYFPEFALNAFTVKILNQVIHYTQSHGSELIHYEKFFFPLDAIHDWNKGYGKRGFIQYQFVIPLEQGRKNIRTILEKIANSDCVPFLNVLKKFGAQQGLLSFPFEGYTFAIDFPITLALANFTKQLDKMVLDFGGRIYLGKDAMLDKPMFYAMYPDAEKWKAIKHTYDPDIKFSSSLAKRIGLV